MSERSPHGSNGRHADGTFAAGNQLGKGNPFARRVGALRSAFFAEASEEDLRVLCRQLLDKAKAGDLAAAKLALLWLVGKPAEAQNPDRVDYMEAVEELARVMQTTQGGRARRRPAPTRPNRAKETGDTGAFGQGYAHPTRDAIGSTRWGAVSRTDRFWSGVSPLLSDDVLFPASPLPAVYTRAGGKTVPISSGGAQIQSA